jgi:membrane-associated protein
MEWLRQLLDIVLHFNLHLASLAGHFGLWIYLLLFLIVFCENGIVLTPFLPGDALLFTVGTLTTPPTQLSLTGSLALLSAAAVVGVFFNYWVGSTLGERLFKNPDSKILNPKHLKQTHTFFERYGAKTILLARYIPVVRTFAPFVAGLSKMDYKKFALYNVIGGLIWVFALLYLGHFFGSLPYVQKNFSLVIGGIIVISMIPPSIEALKAWRGRSGTSGT